MSNFNAVTGLSVPLLKKVLPIGISFYTFQILSYTVDVYRGDVKPQKSFINLAAYITMFPQLIAGPIVRYSDVESDLDQRSHSFEKAAGKQIPYEITPRRPGDIAACYADPSKAKAELNWTATRGVKEMCEDVWRWQQSEACK